jgi:ribonucleoside-diphosphate reductase beta chain
MQTPSKRYDCRNMTTDTSVIIERVENTPLAGLKDLDIDDVYVHIDTLLAELPGPLDLYKRWERQQWSATELDFSTDKVQWEAFHPFVREQMRQIFSGFFVGEQAVTDTLAPILIAAPDEESRWFLSTQVVDEARHAYFFSRFFNEVVVPGSTLTNSIDSARRWTRTKAYDEIFGADGYLISATEAVRMDPQDYGKWVESIVVYHVMVEGILALVGQKLVMRVLRNLDLLPAFRAGFTAVTRDESRHVNYGIWALRRAAQDGHADRIRATVDRTLRATLRVYVNPQRLIDIPDDIPPASRVDPRNNWTYALDSLTRRLRAAGIDEGYLKQKKEEGWEIIWSSVAEYEGIHKQDHPVREWESGRIQELIAAAS